MTPLEADIYAAFKRHGFLATKRLRYLAWGEGSMGRKWRREGVHDADTAAPVNIYVLVHNIRKNLGPRERISCMRGEGYRLERVI